MYLQRSFLMLSPAKGMSVRWYPPLDWGSTVWTRTVCLKQQGLQEIWNSIAVVLWQKGGIPTDEERTGWLRIKTPYCLWTEHHTRWDEPFVLQRNPRTLSSFWESISTACAPGEQCQITRLSWVRNFSARSLLCSSNILLLYISPWSIAMMVNLLFSVFGKSLWCCYHKVTEKVLSYFCLVKRKQGRRRRAVEGGCGEIDFFKFNKAWVKQVVVGLRNSTTRNYYCKHRTATGNGNRMSRTLRSLLIQAPITYV